MSADFDLNALVLRGYWRSSASWRVRTALSLKGLSWTTVPVHLVRDGGEQHQTTHRTLNPMGQVPVLTVARKDGTEHHLVQSMAILEFLEEVIPSPALLPSDPIARAHVRALAEVVNSGIQPLQNLAVLNAVRDDLKGDPKAWGRDVIRRGLVALETMATPIAQEFLAGDTPSYADICLIPQLYNARRFKTQLDDLPTLLRVEERCLALPAFQAAHPDAQPDAVTSA